MKEDSTYATSHLRSNGESHNISNLSPFGNPEVRQSRHYLSRPSLKLGSEMPIKREEDSSSPQRQSGIDLRRKKSYDK